MSRESNTSTNGTCIWKCRSPADTEKLLAGHTVLVLWDNRSLLPMTVVCPNKFKVDHDKGSFFFVRCTGKRNTLLQLFSKRQNVTQ